MKRRTLSTVLVLFFVLAALGLSGCAEEDATDGDATEKPGADIKVAMVTDVNGLGDKSFNDLSWAGIKKAETDFGVQTKVLVSKAAVDWEPNISEAANAGYSPVFAVGFLMTDVVKKLAPTFPDTKFGGVDEFFDPTIPNVVGLNFKEQEGCYLAGVVAGLATKETFDARLNPDNVIGFVGGMDVPLIRKFQAGYTAGAKSVNPDVKVIPLYVGNFDDQTKAKELGLELIDKKADIVFAAAGLAGLGTIQACQEKGALFIGVDADQYLTVPNAGDVILTSMIKKVDVATYDTIKSVVDGTFAGGTNAVFGLNEGGVDIAPFHDFETKVPQTIKDAVEKARQDIISAAVVVPEK